MITYILLGGNLDLHLATFLYLVTMAAFTLVLSILIVLSGFRIFLVVKVGSTLYFLLLVFYFIVYIPPCIWSTYHVTPVTRSTEFI